MQRQARALYRRGSMMSQLWRIVLVLHNLIDHFDQSSINRVLCVYRQHFILLILFSLLIFLKLCI